MKLPNVLILDLNASQTLGETVQKILSASREISVVLTHQPGGHNLRLTKRETLWSQLAVPSFPNVCILVFYAELFKQACLSFQHLKKSLAGIPVIAITNTSTSDEILELLQLGVADFITLPLKASDVFPRVWRLLRNNQLEAPLPQDWREGLRLKQLVGASPLFLELIKKISVVAQTDANILILGETGTGKELCARAIHYLSARSGFPFVPVNCGAIPAELAENELFGHEQGAFTGAATPKPGLIEEAHNGTLLLDEVDSLPLLTQAKLLRFLQEKEYRPLGSTKTVYSDVRIIAASNSNLKERVLAGKMREDLYYRLNVVPLLIPPLRDRPEDILPLANHFSAKYAEALGKPVPSFSPDAQHLLLCYPWPGNVRELEHVVEYALIFSSQPTINGYDLALLQPQPSECPESFQEMKAKVIAQFEKSCIQGLLLAHNGNITKAAQAAKKHRRAFFELMRKHHIQPHPMGANH